MQILMPNISCICHSLQEETDAVTQGYKEIYTIVKDEYFKRHVFRGENRFIRLKVDSIPGYVRPASEIIPAEMTRQEIAFLPAGKISYDIWEQIIAFFKKVMEVKKSEVEAMIHVLYNAERGYHIGVPPQTVSKGSASYDWEYVPTGTSVIVDIHSH